MKKALKRIVIGVWFVPLLVSAQTPIDAADLTALSQTMQTIELHIKQNTTARLAGEAVFADPVLEQALVSSLHNVVVQSFSLFCPVPTTVSADATVRLDCAYTLISLNGGTLPAGRNPTYFILAPSAHGWQVTETDLHSGLDVFSSFDADWLEINFWSIFFKMFVLIWLLNAPGIAFVIWMMVDAWKRDHDNRVMWLCLMFFFSYLAAFIYYFYTRRKKIAEQQGSVQANKTVYWGIGMAGLLFILLIISPQIVLTIAFKNVFPSMHFFPGTSLWKDTASSVDESQPNLLDYGSAQETITTGPVGAIDLSADTATDDSSKSYGNLGFTYEQLQQVFIEYRYVFDELFSLPENNFTEYMGIVDSNQSSLLVDVFSDTNEVNNVSISFLLPKNDQKRIGQMQKMEALLSLAQVNALNKDWLSEQYQQGKDTAQEYSSQQIIGDTTVIFTYNKPGDLVTLKVHGPEL